ncbi:MAG: AsmA-like C-terminal region-containing protein [Saprospiraceae bacterium]
MALIQQKIITGLKIAIILFLVIAIGFIAIIQWKGDAIVGKVIGMIETNLQDSLHYKSIHLEWFRYFPSVALRLDGLILGPGQEPLIEGGHVDIVLQLLPLFRENIIINRLLISHANLNIVRHDSHWSYEVFKKSDTSKTGNWNALIRLVRLEETMLVYNDHEEIALTMKVDEGKIEGMLSGKLLDADIDLRGILNELSAGKYTLPSEKAFTLSGNYKKDQFAGTQKYTNWSLHLEGLKIDGSGYTHTEKNQEYLDAILNWKNGNAQDLIKLIPSDMMKGWEGFTLKGETEGQLKINGGSSALEIPHVICNVVLIDGIIQFPGGSSSLKDVLVKVFYENGDVKSNKKSILNTSLMEGSFEGHPVAANIRLVDLDHPVLSMDLNGSWPAEFLNLITSGSGFHFQKGTFDVNNLTTTKLSIEGFSINKWLEKSKTDLSMSNIHFTYQDGIIEVSLGEIHLDDRGHLKLKAGKLGWNKARAEDVNGEFDVVSDKMTYTINGNAFQGSVESMGSLTGLGQKPVLDAEWKMKGVEIKEVMASFDNFDQSFITSENIKGKTNIWAQTKIPYDVNGNIRLNEILASAAVDIKNGELENMKTLEDFSRYIHLEDLRDIKFNELRNYLRIEGGKVYLPVVFIQSSAINMSVSGVHGFDQNIQYHLKINAGQAASNKLRKLDASKQYKKTRKSGWVNLYYVLSGTTSAVKYEQDQKEVLSGFEQSSLLKENLRTYLVDHFGYDVYWLEPNEWEDVPEYE